MVGVYNMLVNGVHAKCIWFWRLAILGNGTCAAGIYWIGLMDGGNDRWPT